MANEKRLFVDQFGQKWYAKTIRELREQIPGRCGKMYVDGKDGKTYHVGYVIGSLWLRMYKPVRNAV